MFVFLPIIFVFSLAASMPSTKAKEDVRIVGGEDIDITMAPYQVSLIKNGRHSCGGSIIAKDIILTAAHCVVNTGPRLYSVRVGSSYNEKGGEIYQVDDLLWHPKFTYANMDSDVAILLLSKHLQFNDSVASIDLLEQGKEIEDGDITMVSGWGNIREGGGYPSTLQMVLVPIVNPDQCAKAYSPAYSVTSSMLCAGVPQGGKDACQGDSGGPMVYDDRLAGVVSWGLGCARPEYPGVYAKISALRTWIDENIKLLRLRHTLKPFPLSILDTLFG